MTSMGGSEHSPRQPPNFSSYGLHSTGGRFNFDTYEIDARFLNDPVFVFHEQEHNGFVRGTVFGWVQHVAEILQRDTRSRHLETFKWTLWQASEKTHERGATFCSIKAFSPDRHGELISMLPDLYRDWYQDMANTIDRIFVSSYMQYALGKAITNHALNAGLHTLLASLQDSIQLRDLSLSPDYSPDMRWDQIVDAISSHGLSMFAQRTYVVTNAHREGIGLALNGPIDAEETWSALNSADATALDECVYRALLEVLREVAASVSTVEPERFEEAQREAAAALGRLTGNNFEVRRAGVSETAGTQADLKSGIRNDQALDIDRIYRLTQGDLPAHWLSGDGPRRAVSMFGVGDLDSSEWLVELGRDESVRLVRTSHKDYSEVLAMRARLALLGSPIAELPTMARINDPQQFNNIYSQLASFFMIRLQDGFLDLMSHNIHWYMAGDLKGWWHELRQYGPMRVLPLVPLPMAVQENAKPFQSKEEVHRSLESLKDRPFGDSNSLISGERSFLVCEFDHLIGRFVRAFPPYAMTSFFNTIGDEFELFALSDRESIADGVLSLFSLADLVWPTL